MSSPSPQARRLTRNFTWLSVQEGLTRVTGLVTAVYLARTLSPESYGTLGLALAVVAILATLVRAGIGSRGTRQTALNPDSVPEIYAQLIGFGLFSAAAGMLFLLALAPLLSRIFSFPPTLLVLCSLLLIRPALKVVWAFRGLDRMHVNAAANVIEKVLALLGIVLLVKGNGSDVLWVPVVEVTAALVVAWWLRKRLKRLYPRLAIEFRARDWPGIARETLPLGLGALMASVCLHGAILLLGWLDTAESAAGFLVAQKITLTLAVLMIVINRAAFPSASRLLSRDPTDALLMLTRLMRYYLVMGTPVFLLVAFHAEAVLAALFGPAYSGFEPVLVILLVSLPIVALNNSLLLLLRAIPRPGFVLASRTVGAAALLLLAALSIPRVGITGAALAVVGGDFATMTVLLVLVRRAAGGLPLNARCLAPLFAGCLAAVAYAVVGDWPVLFGLSLFATVYLGAIWVTKGVTIGEIRSLPRLILQTAREPT